MAANTKVPPIRRITTTPLHRPATLVVLFANAGEPFDLSLSNKTQRAHISLHMQFYVSYVNSQRWCARCCQGLPFHAVAHSFSCSGWRKRHYFPQVMAPTGKYHASLMKSNRGSCFGLLADYERTCTWCTSPRGNGSLTHPFDACNRLSWHRHQA